MSRNWMYILCHFDGCLFPCSIAHSGTGSSSLVNKLEMYFTDSFFVFNFITYANNYIIFTDYHSTRSYHAMYEDQLLLLSVYISYSELLRQHSN
jgi:hypothetical protein